MLAAFFVEELFDMLLKRTGLGKRELLLHGIAEWQGGSTLQLQRIVYENLGVGTCKRTNELVPVTDKIFGVFDTTDRKHARLVKQSIYTGVSEVSISGNDSVESTVDLESNNGAISNSYTDGIDSTLLSASGGNQYHRVPSGNVDSRASYTKNYNADNDGHKSRVSGTSARGPYLRMPSNEHASSW
jgi:hypothetical protein